MKKISISKLKECLDYDPETGAMTWKERPLSHFKDARAQAIVNTTYAGKPAGNVRGDGYILICLFGKRFLAHRLAWAMSKGRWPKKEVDHIDGKTSNNRILNLRDISHESNQRNMKKNRTNTSGVNGVGWSERLGKWQAFIKIHDKTMSLGTFKEKGEAVAAREAADRINNFHEGHGKR